MTKFILLFSIHGQKKRLQIYDLQSGQPSPYRFPNSRYRNSNFPFATSQFRVPIKVVKYWVISDVKKGSQITNMVKTVKNTY